jgi:outer membrane protein assembly factor BamB
MQSEATLRPVPSAKQVPSSAPPARPWPALVFVSVFWALLFAVGALEKPYFYGFIFGMAAPALLLLAFGAWWWTRRRVRFSARLYGCALVVGTGVLAAFFCDRSVWFLLPTLGLPIVLTVCTLWMFLVGNSAGIGSQLVLCALVTAVWTCFPLIRVDGDDADLRADMRWRWNPTEEDLFLTERAARRVALSPAAQPPITATAGDWTGFRGPDREGISSAAVVAADWSATPPKLLWRQRVGPAWSSVIVIGERLYTQEQRGERETVICYEAATGKELWTHEDPVRFKETVSGAGPRATPTFAESRVYTLGATGILNCLDAVTGRRHWSRDITADAGATVPMWGFSGSPLVVGDLVIVYAGGDQGKSLLSYKAATGGAPVWTAAAGNSSYSSPHLARLGGTSQCLMLSDDGLTAVDPATGSVLWRHGLAMPGAPRTLQPHAVGSDQLVVGSLAGPGVARIQVKQDGQTWSVSDLWESTRMAPEFPDFVVHDGYMYGFDLSTFCCLDAATGKRAWREGRYGRGQVLLLSGPSLLLVLSETGEAVLLAANPRAHEVLGRFQALEGKTWNHPVIAHGRLYVRNAQEMACYELGVSTQR